MGVGEGDERENKTNYYFINTKMVFKKNYWFWALKVDVINYYYFFHHLYALKIKYVNRRWDTRSLTSTCKGAGSSVREGKEWCGGESPTISLYYHSKLTLNN